MQHGRFAIFSLMALAAVVAFSDTSLAQQGDDMSSMPGMNMPMDMAKPPAGSAAGKVGDIELQGGFVRAMLPGQAVGGGFLTIHNAGAGDDRLVSATSPAAGKVEFHSMTMDNNIMTMREVKDGIAVPAGATVALKPGGLHMMFKQVKEPFRQGAIVPVTLTFEKAGTVDIQFPVSSAQAK